MKRSKKIHLVLITAALASCNRQIIPSQPDMGYVTDPSLMRPNEFADSSYECFCSVNDSTGSNVLYNSSGYWYNGQPYDFFYRPGHIYRRGTFWRSPHQVVVRGGFGKSSVSSGS